MLLFADTSELRAKESWEQGKDSTDQWMEDLIQLNRLAPALLALVKDQKEQPP